MLVQKMFSRFKKLGRQQAAVLRLALVITRREVRDTLRDWRILAPIIILSTAFPFLANFAAGRGLDFVNQYGADLIMTRLFPFLMLVVGFFPSSFSLVIALEVFVGEKERHSLEPLLASPLTDLQLYLGKLFSAIFTPVVASYFAINFYMLLVGLTVGWWPTLSLYAVTMVLSTAQAFVMVSAAVVISSQATSARAANLIASFIILPLAFLLQGEAGLLLFGDYDVLWLIALFLSVTTLLFVRMGIHVFNREHLLGRAIDALDVRGGWRTFWQACWPQQGVKRLYTQDIPRQLRVLWPEIIFTLLVVLGGSWAVGLWGAHFFPLPVDLIALPETLDLESFDTAVQEMGLLSSFSWGALLWNNIRSLLFAAFLAFFSLGTLAEILLLLPLAIIAYLMLQVPSLGISAGQLLTAFVLPHGVPELLAGVLATAQAMRMGVMILRSPAEGGGVSGMIREFGHFCRLFLAVALPLLTIAAWIEVEITPQLAINFLQSW
ncbi:MAG: stage II sporulation protein M [Chloroflexota bacterium]|nr:stage II sporulation protein M [Chloroflexota bacterium]